MSDLASKCAEVAETNRLALIAADVEAEKSATVKIATPEEKIPMCGSKADQDFAVILREYDALIDRREYLISQGVDRARLLLPIKPKRATETTALPYKAHTNLGECVRNQDTQETELDAKRAREHEAQMRLQDENPLMTYDTSLEDTPPASPESMYAHGGVIKVPGPMKYHGELHVPQYEEPGITREKIDAMTPEEIAEVGEPFAEYIFDGNPMGKDSNPKEAFGTRKAGTSCIPTQVKYELGLAMLEGALKYGRHNYRIAGVRGSTYYDACGRHMDDWWEGEDLDPKSGAKLHHIVKAMAGLAVLRDSIIAGNWTDDRPPRIGNPEWLNWYNEQAEIMVDACKNPKPPYTELEHSLCRTGK